MFYSKYVEIGIVVFEAVLLIGFAIPGYSMVKYDKLSDTSSDDLEVRVVAQQFAWNIHYPGADGKFGNTMVELVDEETHNHSDTDYDWNTENGADLHNIIEAIENEQ